MTGFRSHQAMMAPMMTFHFEDTPLTAAAITAMLVDVRNVNAHKCVRLEIHVPAEQAGAVMAAFGWPTMVTQCMSPSHDYSRVDQWWSKRL